MTFETSAWAIDGALLGSSLARRAEYAAVGGAQGVVQSADLKVTQLAVPGVGLLIAPGVGLLNNKYQTNPNETYVVSNPGSHTITSGEMPGALPSATSWIVAVVVGDPDFSQVGHPWMSSDDPPVGEEQTFTYVRPTLIQVANSSVKTLDVPYPALPLARIDIPASTTTITNSMITDLRHLARPRSDQTAFISPGGTWTSSSPVYIPAGNAYADWGRAQFAPSVQVPDWATRAIVIVHVNGVRFKDDTVNIAGGLRAQIGTVTGPITLFDYDVDTTKGGAQRENLMCAGEFNVSSIRGQNAILRVEGFQNVPANPNNDQRLRLQNGSQMVFDVRFFEE